VPRIAKLVDVQQQEVRGKVLDHVGRNLSAAPRAGAVWRLGGLLAE
jgi:hypothetical protein